MELPESYGRTRLTLMEVDPFHLYAYWDVTREDWLRANAVSNAWILRFQEGEQSFDIPIDPTTPHKYLEFPRDDRGLIAEIGVRDARGSFVPLCRSNPLRTPRSAPSPRYEPVWMNRARVASPAGAGAPAVPLEAPPGDFGLSSEPSA
jgi:hypothetical protein